MPEIQTNDSNRIFIEEKEFKGREYIDVRKQFLGDNGDWISTRKGLTVTPEEWEEIIEVLLPMLSEEFQEKISSPEPQTNPDDVPFLSASDDADIPF